MRARNSSFIACSQSGSAIAFLTEVGSREAVHTFGLKMPFLALVTIRCTTFYFGKPFGTGSEGAATDEGATAIGDAAGTEDAVGGEI